MSEDPSAGNALSAAIEELQAGRLQSCEGLLNTLLQADPEDVGALHVQGALLHRQGRPAEAIAALERCVGLAPDHAAAWNNLGNVRLAAGQVEGAATAYHHAIDASPDDPNVVATLVNLAALQRRQGQLEAATESCRRALAIDDTLAPAWYALARVLALRGLLTEALQAHAHAIRLAPDRSTDRERVVMAILARGGRDVAIRLFRDWLAESPDNPSARHLLAACGGAEVPPRADDAYVTQVFDAFADDFDAKLEQLGYRAPQLLADALGRCARPQPASLDLCDAGCGTGLAGVLLRPWARRLAGCDLSVGMLRRARTRGVYDALHRAELVHYLDTQPGAFDAVVAADVLCYFGALDDAFRAAARSLRPAGWLAFSVEALPDADPEGSRLMTTGRYAHRGGYLRMALAGAGFEVAELASETLRLEGGLPVPGWVVVAQRCEPAQPGHFSPPNP